MADVSLLEALETLAPEWTEDRRSELEPMLRTDAVRAGLAKLLAEFTDTGNFTSFNFADPNDVVKATRQQGRIEGVIQFIERLGELVEKDDGTTG